MEKVASMMDIEKISEDMMGGTAREVQRELCDIFSVEPDQLPETVERFREENREIKNQMERLAEFMYEEAEFEITETGTLVDRCRSLYRAWKENEKELESLEKSLEGYLREEIEDRVLKKEVPTENVGLLIEIARKLARNNQASITLMGDKGAVSASYHEDYDADENLSEIFKEVQGDENFAKAFN